MIITFLQKIFLLIGLIPSLFLPKEYKQEHDVSHKTLLNKSNGNIVLRCYSYGGTTDFWTNDDSSRFFAYSNDNYILNYVFYSGDIFCPYLIGKGYLEWNEDVSLNKTTEFEKLLLAPYVFDGIYSFKVQRAGTYKFIIPSETLSFSKPSQIWNESDIIFDPSTDIYEPKGNADIYLHGAFDGCQFSNNNYESKRFTFNKTLNTYELMIGLYEGDVFCPYFESKKSYIGFPGNFYSGELIDSGFFISSPDNKFICNKTGTYCISISYKVEYFENLNFLWTEDGGSEIIFYSQNIIEEECTGLEEILFVGSANGEYQYNTNSKYLFSYNSDKKVYELNIYLKAGDYFIFFLKKKDLYVNGNAITEYARHLMEISGLTTYVSSNRTYFMVENSGLYYFALDGTIENIYNPNEVWKNHSKSTISFLGNPSSTMYFLSKNISTIFISTSNSVNNINQYNNFVIKSNVLTKLGGESLNIFKIRYDEKFSTTYEISLDKNKTNQNLRGELTNGYAYFIDERLSSKAYGNVAKFLSFLEDTIGYNYDNGVYLPNDINNMDLYTLDAILNEFNSLNSEEKLVASDSKIKINYNGEISEINILNLTHTISNIISKSTNNSFFFLYLIIIISLNLAFLYFMLCYKKNRRRKHV